MGCTPTAQVGAAAVAAPAVTSVGPASLHPWPLCVDTLGLKPPAHACPAVPAAPACAEVANVRSKQEVLDYLRRREREREGYAALGELQDAYPGVRQDLEVGVISVGRGSRCSSCSGCWVGRGWC